MMSFRVVATSEGIDHSREQNTLTRIVKDIIMLNVQTYRDTMRGSFSMNIRSGLYYQIFLVPFLLLTFYPKKKLMGLYRR